MAEEAKWYVAHTYSGYENKVKDNIEKSIENLGMQNLIFEVKVPVEEIVEEKENGDSVWSLDLDSYENKNKVIETVEEF